VDAKHHVKAWQLIIIGGRLRELKHHRIHVLSVLKATAVFKLHDGASEHVHINFISSFGANLFLLPSLPLLRQPRRAGQQVLDTSHPTVMTDSVKNGTDEERVKNRKRFELELEFVQALANPFYLHSLAQQGILYQPAFINYLKYLLYWKEKDYARFIL
jgi:hypothetical protein